MNPDSYFLPKAYKENPVNISLDQDDTNYWDSVRIKHSLLYQFAVYQWAEKLIKTRSINTIVDVGCGVASKLAWLYERFPNLNFWGIDQHNAITHCKSHYNFGNWLGVDFENKSDVPSVKADLIISSDVIEHLENPNNLLDYFKRIIADDGLILISTPERISLRGAACFNSPNPYHVREWSKVELSQYLQSCDFNIIEHKILPAMRFDMSIFYLKSVLKRWRLGRSMRFNQAAIMQVKAK